MSEHEDWESEGGAVQPMLCLELAFRDMQYLMNKAHLDNTPQDRRILDAFRRAFLDGHNAHLG